MEFINDPPPAKITQNNILIFINKSINITSTTINGHKAKVRILVMSFDAFNRTFIIPGGDLPIRAYIIGWDCPESDSKIVVVVMFPN